MAARTGLDSASRARSGVRKFARVTGGNNVIKSGPGVLHGIINNKPVVSAVATIYDSSAASGTVIGALTMSAATIDTPESYDFFDMGFENGLTIACSTTIMDLTIVWS